MTLEYYLEIDPIPSNTAYSSRIIGKGNRRMVKRFLTNYARNWKSAVTTLLKLQDGFQTPIIDHARPCLILEIQFFWKESDFRYKNGKFQRRDCTGHVKLLEDALSEYLQIDDTYNTEVRISKSMCTFNHILVRITEDQDSIDEHCP